MIKDSTQLSIAFAITGYIKVCHQYAYSIIGTWRLNKQGVYTIDLPNGHMATNDKISAYTFCIKKYAEQQGMSDEEKIERFRDFMQPMLNERQNRINAR